MQMWQSMGFVAKAVAFILFIMSMWSFGVAIERIFTYTQARNQSKMYAPQVAKHLKEGRLKDAIALSSSKNYRYNHLSGRIEYFNVEMDNSSSELVDYFIKKTA